GNGTGPFGGRGPLRSRGGPPRVPGGRVRPRAGQAVQPRRPPPAARPGYPADPRLPATGRDGGESGREGRGARRRAQGRPRRGGCRTPSAGFVGPDGPGPRQPGLCPPPENEKGFLGGTYESVRAGDSHPGSGEGRGSGCPPFARPGRPGRTLPAGSPVFST